MTKSKRSERREDALSRDRIVEEAIELLDDEGEDGLTFRALATRLETGPGAIYWHIANRSDLLTAVSEALVSRAMSAIVVGGRPRKALHGIAVAVFDLIDSHPWIGAELMRAPWKSAMLQIFERLGRQVEALGVKGNAQFTSTSTLLNYIVGVSVQSAISVQSIVKGGLIERGDSREDFLAKVSAAWKALDADEYPFTRNIASRLRDHDDRAEFLAGVDLILAGVASL